jgi:hypothetical protein
MMKEGSSVRNLLGFSFDLIKLGGISSYGRIPYLLIADLLEGQTIENAEKLWNLVECFIDYLTDPESFRTGSSYHYLLSFLQEKYLTYLIFADQFVTLFS